MKTFLLAVLLAAAPAVHASGVTRAAAKKQFQAAQPAAPAEGAEALSDEDAKSQMAAFLGSIDTPISAKQWAALGTRVGPWLEAIAKNPSEMPTRRAKAVDGMIASKWSHSAASLRELSRDESAPANVRFHSVRGLGELLSKDKIERELVPVLEGAKDARVRAVAAEQITLRSSAGCAAFQRQLAREDEGQKALFHRAIAACGGAQK